VKSWLAGLLLFLPLGVGAQSVLEFPKVRNVSSVTVIGPVLFFDLDGIVPQQAFRTWWEEVEICTAVQRPFDAVKWYVTGTILNVVTMRSAWGLYYPTPPEIVVVRDQTPERIEQTVKHEVLHHLLGVQGHKNQAFKRCLPTNGTTNPSFFLLPNSASR
jgi:hypothetical protein